MMEDTLPPASMVQPPRNAHSGAANLADPNDPVRRKKQLRYQKHVSTRRGGGKEEQPLRVTVMPASSPAAANAGVATAAAAGKQPQTLADRRTRILRRQLRSAPTGDHKDTLLKKLATKKHQVLTKPPAPAPLLQQTAIAPDPPSIPLQDESDDDEEEAVYQEFDIVSGQRSHDMGPSPTSFSEPEDAFMNGSNYEPREDNYDNDDIYDTAGSPDHAMDRYAMANPSYEAVLADALTESVDHDEYDDDDDVDVDDDCVDNQVLDLLQQNDDDDDDDSAGWDTRHVLEHPPEPVQHYESAVAVEDVDDAWDTSQRISFGDGEEKKSHDVDDVPSAFDPHEFMSSDGVSDVDFSAVSISQVEDYLLVETRRLAAEQQRQEMLLERKETVLPKDNEALLADSDTRSDVPGTVESDALPQQRRIENYLKPNEGYVSSDDDTIGKDAVPEHKQEEGDDDDDDENVQDAADAVHYVSHDAVANEQDLDEVPMEAAPEGEKAAYAYSSFEPANRAANEAEEICTETTQSLQAIKPPRPTIQVENLDMLTLSQVPSKDTSIFELSLDSVVGEGFLPGGSVGANSVYSRMTKDSARSSTKAEDSSPARKALPMIKPPPEEKLKKWEEQKMRPLKHLEAVKKEKEAETSNKVDQPLDLFTQMESTEQRGSMFGLDDQESVMYAKMTVGAITERQSGFGSVSRDGAKAKWKNLRKEDDAYLLDQAETQAELELVAQEAAVAATPPIESGDILSDAASESVAGPPEILRKHQTTANSLTQQRRVLWNGSTEPVPVDGAPVAQSHGEEPKSLHESIEADHHPTPTAQVSFALSDGSRSSKASIDKSLSISDSLKNSKIAAQVAVVSSKAERKFDERFEMAKAVVHAEEDDIVKASPMTIASVEDDFPKTGTTSFFSCGGGNSFLNVSGFDTVVEDEPFDVSKTVNLSVMKKVACIDVSSPSSRSFAQGYSVEDESHNTGVDLIGGAFSPWRNATYAKTSDAGVDDSTDLVEDDILDTGVAAKENLLSEGNDPEEGVVMSEDDLMAWLDKEVFKVSIQESLVIPEEEPTLESILREKGKLEILCAFVAEQVNETIESGLNTFDQNATTSPTGQRKPVSSFSVPETSGMAASVLAANFVSYLQRISKLTGTKSPFDDGNPFLDDIIGSSLFLKSASSRAGDGPVTVHDKIFGHEQGKPVDIVRFFFVASESTRRMLVPYRNDQVKPAIKKGSVAFPTLHNANFVLPGRVLSVKQYHKPPKTSPGPFETTFWSMPSVVLIVLGFLGDPVVVCRMKMVNQYCSRIIAENEHIVMRDAVRLGGMSMNVRPAFWIWITLEKGGRPHIPPVQPPSADGGEFGGVPSSPRDGVSLGELEKIGREGKWHHVIGRDVARAFGNMPPHKTGARFRTDSIVRALITWGQGRVMKRGVKGGGEELPTPTFEGRRQRVKPRQSTAPPPWEVGDDNSNITDASQTPTETVSDWGGVSPVGSFASSIGDDQKNARGNLEGSNSPDRQKRSRAVEELALSGNALTNDMKQGLQNQLGFILHALAAAHQDVGYCQGMDYVVAHLLRVLQDTVRWRAVKGTLPSVIVGGEKVPHVEITDASQIDDIAIDESMVVEETVFRVMDCFFTSYNLRHMYWPELRCLKTCCLVFERLIQLKLPVLADHFEHHELNVGLFALGWFQTLFLYLPSMPSATVCHMWDIWLVERSFKIFFRVGTAILFLSQPILLNHEMEGMMTYLNTFPDATLLNPDILIACALQIKVTNKMLMEIESAVTGGV